MFRLKQVVIFLSSVGEEELYNGQRAKIVCLPGKKGALKGTYEIQFKDGYQLGVPEEEIAST